jgi:O-methyltransferase
MSIEELVDKIILDKVSMVYKENFDTVLQHKDTIANLEGDIVECGCWRGGFSIFLSKLFKDKKIWVFDSFEGFQDLSDAKYNYSKVERHIPSFTHNQIGQIGVPYEITLNNFKDYGLEDDINSERIRIVKGFVRDTTKNIDLEKISLLRIDVDSYSAVLEVLYNMYPKVVDGGYIIFDDSGLRETFDAMVTFFTEHNLPLSVIHPNDGTILEMGKKYANDETGLPPGCFIIKKI